MNDNDQDCPHALTTDALVSDRLDVEASHAATLHVFNCAACRRQYVITDQMLAIEREADHTRRLARTRERLMAGARGER